MANLWTAHRLAEVLTLIKRRMQEIPLTRQQLIESLGADAKAAAIVDYWFTGKGAPGPKYATKLAEILGVQVDDIVLHPKSSALVPVVDPPQVVPVQVQRAKRVSFTVEGDFEGDVTITLRSKGREAT